MCRRLLDTISFVFLWIYVLPFRVKSYVLSSPWITALQPRQALVHTELQYHPQYLYGFNHPTNLYLIYHTIDTATITTDTDTNRRSSILPQSNVVAYSFQLFRCGRDSARSRPVATESSHQSPEFLDRSTCRICPEASEPVLQPE